MTIVHVDQRPSQLRRPVLLAAFRGWSDAGESASGAVEALRSETAATTFAFIDPEEFFDFQAVRPTVRLVEGGSRALDWPTNEFALARLPGADRDIVLLSGTEPNLRWQTFSRAVVDLAAELGVELAVTLGALQVDVPHTRPTPLTTSASDPELSRRLGVGVSRYEGPTGITGVVHHACAQAGLPAVSLWAGVPHYLAGSTYNAGAVALAEAVLTLLEADVSLDWLARDAAQQIDDIGRLVADDEDLAEYVSDLEQRADRGVETTLPVLTEDDLPEPQVSADQLAAEVERFLRGRREG